MESKYILLEWVAERKYSVVKRQQIADAEDRAKHDEILIGTEILVAWKSKSYLALIIQCGCKIDMNHELDVLTKQQKSAKLTLSRLARADVQKNIQNVLGDIEPEAGAHGSVLKISELEFQLSAALERSEKYKNKYKNLKRKYDQVVNINNTEEREEISDGVTLPKCQLDTNLSLSGDGQKLAINLMQALFREDEMIGHSLFGVTCNANLGSPARPSIDPLRRNAIIFEYFGIAVFVMKKYGGQASSQNAKKKSPLLVSIHCSMGDHLRYLIHKNK